MKVMSGVQVSCLTKPFLLSRNMPHLTMQGVEEHKKLVASVTKEKELKTRIKELIRWLVVHLV